MKVIEDRIDYDSQPVFTKEAILPSVTSMFDCTHGPKKDCHACIVGELVEVLEQTMDCLIYTSGSAAFGRRHKESAAWRSYQGPTIENARAVLEKAKLIEDCIPVEEAEEASRT